VKRLRGFTLIEIVIALAIFVVIVTLAVQMTSTIEQVLAGRASRQVEQLLFSAAGRARDGMSGTSWGVYLAYDNVTRIPTQATIFSGTSFATRDVSADVIFSLSSYLRMTNVSLSGAGASSGSDHEIVFATLSGATTQYGSMAIDAFGATTTISISSVGIPTLP